MGCDGSCCVAFPISATMDHVRGGRIADSEMLGFMLRPLTTEQAVERRVRFGVKTPVRADEQYYRCIYWDEQTRLCTAYEHRPPMCSEYPCYTKGTPCCHGCNCGDHGLTYEERLAQWVVEMDKFWIGRGEAPLTARVFPG